MYNFAVWQIFSNYNSFLSFILRNFSGIPFAIPYGKRNHLMDSFFHQRPFPHTGHGATKKNNEKNSFSTFPFPTEISIWISVHTIFVIAWAIRPLHLFFSMLSYFHMRTRPLWAIQMAEVSSCGEETAHTHTHTNMCVPPFCCVNRFWNLSITTWHSFVPT
jgi:hypothetical protein